MIFGSTRRSELTRRSTPDRRSTATGSLASRRSLCLRSAFREGATRPISSGRIQFIQCSPMRKAGRASPTHVGIQVFTRVKFVNSAGKCQGQSDKKSGLAADLPVGPLNGDDAGCAGRAVHASESGVPGTRCAGGGRGGRRASRKPIVPEPWRFHTARRCCRRKYQSNRTIRGIIPNRQSGGIQSGGIIPNHQSHQSTAGRSSRSGGTR